MARPKKQTIDYFPHITQHGKTMFIVEQKYGNDGYAFWFKLLEVLGSTDGHYLDLNDDATWEFLQAKTRLDEGFCNGILDLLAKLGSIDPELWVARVIWSQKFVDGLVTVYRNRGVEPPTRPSFYIQKPHSIEVSIAENPQSRVDESRVDESRKGSGETNSPPAAADATPSGDSMHDLTETERALLAELKQVDGYPFDWTRDLQTVRELLIDFPAADILAEIKSWRFWRRDNPTAHRKNPRLGLRNWVAKAKPRASPEPVREVMTAEKLRELKRQMAEEVPYAANPP